jgi:hypothetical protein
LAVRMRARRKSRASTTSGTTLIRGGALSGTIRRWMRIAPSEFGFFPVALGLLPCVSLLLSSSRFLSCYVSPTHHPLGCDRSNPYPTLSSMLSSLLPVLPCSCPLPRLYHPFCVSTMSPHCVFTLYLIVIFSLPSALTLPHHLLLIFSVFEH